MCVGGEEREEHGGKGRESVCACVCGGGEEREEHGGGGRGGRGGRELGQEEE